MSPSPHIPQILRRRRPPRFQRITTGSPAPRVRQICRKLILDKLNDVLSDIRQQLERMPAISGRKDKVLPSRVLADEERRVRRVGAPAHGAVEDLLVFELR